MATPAERILERASEKWQLLPGEIAVINAAVEGSWANLGIGLVDDDFDLTNRAAELPTVRTEFLRWIATDSDIATGIDTRGIRIRGARIDGSLDLSFAVICYPMLMIRCYFSEAIVLDGATIPRLELSGSHIQSLTAGGLQVASSICLNEGFHANGTVSLVGTDIRGSLECTNGRFEAMTGNALSCDQITVNGNVFLNDRFHATGEVQLRAARIGGSLVCTGGHFDREAGTALACDGISVTGYVLLNDKFHANGEVRLLDATIGGLMCTDGRFDPTLGDALSCGRMTVKGTVFLDDGFHASGSVNLLGADIGGNLVCRAGDFEPKEGYAFVGETLRVAGNAFFNSSEDMAFVAHGIVGLNYARIGRNLTFAGATFVGSRRSGLDARNLTVDGVFRWVGVKGSTKTDVDLTNASVLELQDDNNPSTWRACWPEHGQLHLDGFVYQRIGGIPSKQSDRTKWINQRIDWIRLQPGYAALDNRRFHHLREVRSGIRAWVGRSGAADESEFGYTPQPYEQLATVLRQTGHLDEARDVARRKLDDYRTDGEPRRWLWWRNWFLSWSIGHGFQPWRPLIFGLLVIVVGAIIFELAYGNDRLVAVVDSPQGAGSFPWFNPVAYSIDTFLPFVDLNQQASFQPNAKGWEGWGVLAFYWFEISIGWIVSTLFVLGFTNLVRQE